MLLLNLCDMVKKKKVEQGNLNFNVIMPTI